MQVLRLDTAGGEFQVTPVQLGASDSDPGVPPPAVEDAVPVVSVPHKPRPAGAFVAPTPAELVCVPRRAVLLLVLLAALHASCWYCW
jgi:hypothetical protein